MDYHWLKSTHQLLALISLSGFILRWSWRVQGSHLAQLRITRTLPHIVDTVFLLSGLALAWKLALLAALPSWLLAKLIGLVVYILLGAAAMHSVSRRPLSAGFFTIALACFAWIISVAIMKSPLGILVLF